MTSVEKGLIWVAVVIAAGLLIAWVWNSNIKAPETTEPTFKIGDEAAASDDITFPKFNSEMGK